MAAQQLIKPLAKKGGQQLSTSQFVQTEDGALSGQQFDPQGFKNFRSENSSLGRGLDKESV